MRAHRVLPPLLSALLLVAFSASDNTPEPEPEPLLAVVEPTERVLQTVASARVCRGAGAVAGECRAALACTPEAGEPLARAAAVCAAAARGAVAALAGGDARDLRLAAEAAARAALPLLLLDPAPPGTDATWEALQLYPHDSVLAEAAAALCTAKDWQRAVLLHEGGGAALLAGTDDLPSTGSPTLALTARKLPSEDDALRNMLLVLKKSGVTEFIVWCSATCSRQVLDTAQRVGLLGERHSYILLALDLHTLDLSDYSHGGANVTALRLFDPESPELNETLAQWEQQYLTAAQTGEDAAASAAPLAARLRAAPPVSLVLGVVGAALLRAAATRLRLRPQPPANCRSGYAAFHADTLLNYLRSEEWSVEGGGGTVSWEWDGARRAVPLQVVELQRGGALLRVGRWAPNTPVTWERIAEPAPEPPPGSMQNRTFTILIAKNEPYVMIRESMNRLTGNDRYEGFCIELIEKLAELLHFNYTFVQQEDGVYGSYNATTNSWTGMLRRLMDDNSIDFAITDLTITAEREAAVDFTTPFMNLGISILYRTPKQPEPEFFAFLLPFSKGVWVCLGFAYLGTSLVLYVVGRLSPEEWQNPYPCVEEPPALENQFTLGNALWFNLGAMLLQGSEIAPVAYSTRAVASVWWLFALVITSSYTANLATLLAKKSADQPIHNVDELADNTLGIDYGAKDKGSTYTFFEHSQNELFQRMFRHMSQRTMPTSNEEGVARVTSGYDYAFLMESTTIEYIVQRNCNVTMLGSLLDSKGYGIAMKKNSTYRQALNLGLLSLQEAGTLREMKNTWWNEKHGGGACNPADERESAELSMSNFLGLFVVLVVGCALGVALSAADLAWAALRRARLNREPYLRRLWRELRFVFHFDHSVKPVQGPMSESTSPTSTSPRTSPGAAEEVPDEEWHKAQHEAKRTSANATPRRRHSSIHAASLRLARHAARHSGTPAPY